LTRNGPPTITAIAIIKVVTTSYILFTALSYYPTTRLIYVRTANNCTRQQNKLSLLFLAVILGVGDVHISSSVKNYVPFFTLWSSRG